MAASVSRVVLRRFSGLAGLAAAVLAGNLVATSAAAAGLGTGAPVGQPRDISGTRVGVALVQTASARLSAMGGRLRPRDLTVWRDAAGVLIAPNESRLAAVRPFGGASTEELVPQLSAGAQRSSEGLARVGAATDESPPAAWTLVASGCYERISDTWSWLDHCARIYRLTGDGDAAHDTYALQRIATAGPNPPWVLKSASVSATPIDAALMSWTDWSPRNDRSGACQPYVVAVVAPLAGLNVSLDRCESWDITKGAHGGDFRLDWSGCACTHDRGLAFDLVVSVPQGRSPGWYVPAEVHGYPF